MKIPIKIAQIALMSLLSLGLFSCDQPAVYSGVDVERFDYQACHAAAALNARQIERNVKGSWQMSHSRNAWGGGFVEVTGEHTLDLNGNGTFVATNDTETLEGTWEIQGDTLWAHELGLTYTLEGSSDPIQSFEQVFLCEGYLILSSAYLDGPTNYYHRVGEPPLQSQD